VLNHKRSPGVTSFVSYRTPFGTVKISTTTPGHGNLQVYFWSISPRAQDQGIEHRFTWALLLALNARAKWLQVVLWSYVAVIATATIGLGEHYLVDLIAALPYTLGVQWLTTVVNERRLGMRMKHVPFRDLQDPGAAA
jgi:hypothetical protein